MKRMFFSFSIIVVPIVLCISMVLGVIKYGSSASYTQNLFESENDYRLKFVDSADVELGLGITNKVLVPLEILSVKEEDGSIILTTYENSVVFAPVDCMVNSVSGNNYEIELKSGKITVVITGIISGVSAGNKLLCGDVIGTVKGSTCAVKVFWGTRLLALDEIKALL